MGSDTTATTTAAAASTTDADMIIKEAFEVSHGEAVSIMEEGLSAQTLAESFEHYVQNYQASWQADWETGITAFESEVKDWQETVLRDFFQAAQPASPKTQQPQQDQHPQPEPSSPPKGKK